jgi:glycosyltransferase involved in cell wall biosynthesis
MTVTVAICTWNRAEALAVTLDHLTRLRIPAGVDWELLVVNNNCTDDTDAVCQRFAGRLPLRLLHETRPGKSFALNLAIERAGGSHILWTDDDIDVDPEWLNAILAAFEREHADWVFGVTEVKWPSAPPPWYDSRYFLGHFGGLNYGDQSFVVATADRKFFGANCAGTRAAHQALGGFRTDLGLFGGKRGVGEDIDLFDRAFRANMKIVYTPDARVFHRVRTVQLPKRYHRRNQWVASGMYYEQLPDYFPDARWMLGLPRFFYGNFVRGTVGYLRCALTRSTSERFTHELELVRVARLVCEAARSGFRRPSVTPEGTRESRPMSKA